MLKPKYIEQLPDAMIELYSQVEQDVLADMARRISTYDYWIPAAEHQRKTLVEMGNFHSYVMEALSARTGKTREELERLMEEAGEKSISFDAAIYRDQGLDPPPLAESKELQAVLRSGLKQTAGEFTNLTRTTANTVAGQFEMALSRAWLQVSSGAFNVDTAVRMAVKDLAKTGVQTVRYPSGHADTLEVAVRRAVVTGVNQAALRLQDELADEMGSDLVETTAHAGARPDHAEWQGQIFSRSGKSRKYPDFRKSTGYGTGEGLGGWNCRHSFNPYFEGSPRAYTQEILADFEAKNFSYNGHKMTEYEASQQQRYIERQIRRWKRENVAMAAAGQDTAESAAKIRRWQAAQRDFLEQTGLKRQSAREQMTGFGRRQAARAVIDAKNTNGELLRLKRLDRIRQSKLKRNPELALPGAEHVVIEPDKFEKYLFNPENERGYAKGVAFARRLGYDISNWEKLRDEIIARAPLYPASQKGDAGHGMKYEQRMILYGMKGTPANVVVSWIDEGGRPRMTSAYIKEVKEHGN